MQILITFSTAAVFFFFLLPINLCYFYRARHKLQDACSVSRNETHTGAQNSFLFCASFFCPSFFLYFIIPNFSHFCPSPLLSFRFPQFFLSPVLPTIIVYTVYILCISELPFQSTATTDHSTSLTALSFCSGSMLNVDRHFLVFTLFLEYSALSKAEKSPCSLLLYAFLSTH